MQPQWIGEAAVRTMMGDGWWMAQKIRVLETEIASLAKQVAALEQRFNELEEGG